MNCAALPESILEAELFGVKRGAFTGAVARKEGRFERANGGTLFLDEVGEMSPSAQLKLLRVLQEGELERLGGTQTLKVDVRVVAATNKDLVAAIAAGGFREDLYYRLNVIPMQAPPWRTHREDLPELVKSLVARVCDENGMKAKEVEGEALEHLARHDWPGNVRELRNACERLAILTPGSRITGEAIKKLYGEGRAPERGIYRQGVPMKDLVAEAERDIIQQALSFHEGRVTQTAAALGLERSHLYKKMRALGIREVR